MFRKTLTAACFAVGAMSFGGAQAAIVSCPSSIDSLVTGTTSCQYSTTQDQDFLNTNPMTVNQEGGFFGFTDWIFSDKITENGGQSGSWSIESLVSNWTNAMLIFKSGADTFLVGYLIGNGVTSGTWSSPFRNPPFDLNTIRDVSHISVYFRAGEPGETPGGKVPEPAILGLLGFGLAGLALARRRRVV